MGERLDTDSSCKGERTDPPAVVAPAVAEPAEERPGDERAGNEHDLADDQTANQPQAEVRALERAERHQPVAAEGGERAEHAEHHRPLRSRLCPASDEGDKKPGRRKQADRSRRGVSGETAEVLVRAAEDRRQRDDEKRAPHNRERTFRLERTTRSACWSTSGA